ncbi:MAG: hypothetical protein ACRD4Q_06200 [Candidatus Acidiferrales bacterium]
MSPDPGNAGADPGNPQSWNMYSYVLNNPLGLVDPSGLDTCQGWSDVNGSTDESPQDKDSCAAAGGTWIPTLNQTITVNGGPDNSSSPSDSNYSVDLSWYTPDTLAPPQAPGQKQPLLVCAAETANQSSLAQLAGTNGKSGFFNGLANGVLGNTFSSVVSFAYGGSSTEFGTTAYDFGTKATEGTVNAATGAAPITDLGLGAQSAAQISEGVATEGLGGIFTAVKLGYDFGTFLYGVGHCY